jgi:site-specific DNA recombinase
MISAAIYARKSTTQEGRAEEDKSVTRQVENARAWATANDCFVADAHVFMDDGISGAEFDRRPGLQALLRALSPRAPFSVLIVSEQKSIGRETYETGSIIKKLAEAGVEIFEYVHGRSLTPKTWLDKVTNAVLSAADEAHQRQTSERTKEAHTRKVQLGHVVGGRKFGYDNKHVYGGEDVHGNPIRTHTERVINEAEAAAVLRVFQRCDEGYGLKATAKQLTAERVPAPRPFKRKNDETDMRCPTAVRGWSPSTVRAILTCEMYRGVIVWNKTRKRNDWGKVERSRQLRKRAESEWQRIPAEHLRIVPEDLWVRVQTRRAETEGRTLRFSDGRMTGRPPKQVTHNLLAGISQCAICGGGLTVETSPRKRGRVPEYLCARRRMNGTCANVLRIPVSLMNEAVLQAIEEHALTPEAVNQVVLVTERDDHRERQDAIARELLDVGKKIARLVDAVADGADVASLKTRLRELEARQAELRKEASALRPVPRLPQAVVENRLAEWRRMLRQSTPQARAVLQRLLRGRIVFTPNAEGTGYDFIAPTRYDKLFTGIAVPIPAAPDWMAEVTHTEIGVDDTLDGEYCLLLERATEFYVKRVASPTGFEPVFWP